MLYALIAAEEFGVTGEGASQAAQTARSPQVRRLLGAEGVNGDAIGLDSAFAVRAIEARGNYGEIFDRNLGEGGPLGLSRGLNAQWTQGGLLYAPPFR